MYCRKCGTELRDDDEFCYHCGNRTTIMQRVFASKAFVGSFVAIVVVAIAGVLTYLILTGKLNFPQKGPQAPVAQEKEVPTATNNPKKTAEPTATPYVFEPADVTADGKKKMKGLLERVKPFLSYSAPFYANGSHKFIWDNQSATVMALYNLEHQDRTVRYGNDMATIKKATQKEMKKLFGTNYKYKLKYGESYPRYVYRPTGNTIVFNATRIPGKNYNLKVKKITEYEEGKYQLDVEAYLSSKTNGTKGVSQKYTLMVDKDDASAYGYVVTKIKLRK